MWGFLLAVLASGLLVTACGRGPARTPTPTPVPTPTPAATPSGEEGAAEAKAYLLKVFPPGPGRDEVFLQCTTCHGIHVIIIAGPIKDKTDWGNTRYYHETIMRVTEGEVDPIFKYLFEHFNESKPPPPPLPEILMAGWQNYL